METKNELNFLIIRVVAHCHLQNSKFGETVFYEFADVCVRNVNTVIDHHVIPLVRKAMIQYDLSWTQMVVGRLHDYSYIYRA